MVSSECGIIGSRKVSVQHNSKCSYKIRYNEKEKYNYFAPNLSINAYIQLYYAVLGYHVEGDKGGQ